MIINSIIRTYLQKVKNTKVLLRELKDLCQTVDYPFRRPFDVCCESLWLNG